VRPAIWHDGFAAAQGLVRPVSHAIEVPSVQGLVPVRQLASVPPEAGCHNEKSDADAWKCGQDVCFKGEVLSGFGGW
jgi:hypothetical protein